MMPCKIAIAVGYRFAIVDAQDVRHIHLTLGDEHELVCINDEVFPLYRGTTFEESVKVDDVLDTGKYQEYSTYDHQIH